MPQMAYEGKRANVASSAPPPGGGRAGTPQQNEALLKAAIITIFRSFMVHKPGPSLLLCANEYEPATVR